MEGYCWGCMVMIRMYMMVWCCMCTCNHNHSTSSHPPYITPITHPPHHASHPPITPTSNVETLQSQLDGAESRAAQLASRLTAAQAQAAEAQVLTEELQRWKDMAVQIQPPAGGALGEQGEQGGGGGVTPEGLQRVVVGLQQEVQARAAVSVAAQQQCAELQGIVDSVCVHEDVCAHAWVYANVHVNS